MNCTLAWLLIASFILSFDLRSTAGLSFFVDVVASIENLFELSEEYLSSWDLLTLVLVLVPVCMLVFANWTDDGFTLSC